MQNMVTKKSGSKEQRPIMPAFLAAFYDFSSSIKCWSFAFINFFHHHHLFLCQTSRNHHVEPLRIASAVLNFWNRHMFPCIISSKLEHEEHRLMLSSWSPEIVAYVIREKRFKPHFRTLLSNNSKMLLKKQKNCIKSIKEKSAKTNWTNFPFLFFSILGNWNDKHFLYYPERFSTIVWLI